MKFQRRKLSNGITVLHEERELPIVALSITNRFGGANETLEIKGIAHVIEHMLFNGTKTRTWEELSREIEKKGGELNAFTTHDMTSFHFKLPSKHIFTGLEILTDMLNNPTFPEDKFEKEKRVILEEIKMNHDDPRRHALEQIEKNLYDAPFGELVIGSKESVSGLKRDFVAEFYKKMYNPANFIVTIVGKADLDKVCEYLEKNFSPRKDEITLPEIKLHNKETVEERAGLDQAHFIFAFHAPNPKTKEHYALALLDAYLANGMSSKIFLEIREKRGLAYAVKSAMEYEKNYAFYLIYVGTTKEALSQVKKIILEEFEKASQNLTEKDLEEAKEQLIGLREIESEESLDVMQRLSFEEIINKAENYYDFEKNIKNITLEDVKKIAKIKSYSTAVIVPK